MKNLYNNYKQLNTIDRIWMAIGSIIGGVFIFWLVYFAWFVAFLGVISFFIIAKFLDILTNLDLKHQENVNSEREKLRAKHANNS